MVLIKNGHFSNFIFLGNIGHENVFYDILERKSDFVDYKDKKFKKSKNSHFFKGVNPWLWSKNGQFSIFFFRQYRPGKCLLRYYATKKILSRQQNQELQHVQKIDVFPKGLIHGYNQKMAIFPTFFFRQYKAGKCLLRYSRTKKRLSRL